MTERQKQVYDFIVGYIKENMYPPTVREIGNGVGFASTSSVFNHLKALETRGYIKMGESPRAIKVIGYKFTQEEADEQSN